MSVYDELMGTITQLERENAAFRQIVEAVANAEYWGDQQGIMPAGVTHKTTIYSAANIVEQARAVLQKEEL